MKTKKMLAVLSAIVMAGAACLPAVPAKAACVYRWKAAYQEKLRELSKTLDNAEYSHYSLYDVDNNGIPEIFVGGEYCDPCMMYDYTGGTVNEVLSGKLLPAVAEKLTYLYNKKSHPVRAGVSYHIEYIDSTILLSDWSGDTDDHFDLFYNYDQGVLTPLHYYEGDNAADSTSPSNMYYHKDAEDKNPRLVTDDFEVMNAVKPFYETSTAEAPLTDYSLFNYFPDEVEAETVPVETIDAETVPSESTEATGSTETTEPSETPVSEAWREAYKQKLKDYKATLNGYNTEDPLREMWDLKDLNDDNIPELIISNGGYHMAGISIYTFNGSLTEMTSGGDDEGIGQWGLASFNEDNNLIRTSYDYAPGDDDIKPIYAYFDKVGADTLTEEANFYYGKAPDEANSVWEYNGNKVSEATYNAKIAPYDAMNWEEIGRKYSFVSMSDVIDAWKPSSVVTPSEPTEGSTESTETDTEAPTEKEPVIYEKVYSDFIYDTLLKDPGRAALNTTFTEDYDLSKVPGVVSSAIYDFDQDDVKELLVVTREATSNGEDNHLDTAFVLNLYQANEDGEVKLLDSYRMPEEHTVASTPGEWGDEVEMFISGNAVYQKSSTREYASSGPDAICNEFNIIDVTGGKFTPYKLTVTGAAVYDSTGTGTHKSFDGTLLYADEDILANTYNNDYSYRSTPVYADASEVTDVINEALNNQHLDFKSATLEKVESGTVAGIPYENHLNLNIDVNSAVKLLTYTFPNYDEASNPGNKNVQKLDAVMVTKYVAPKPASSSDSGTTSSSSGKSSSSGSSSSSSSKSSSSTSSSTGSPKTGEALPIATGLTAIGALAAGFFSKKKKN